MTMISTLVGLLEFILGCFTLVTIAFMVTLVVPDSPMRQFATQVLGWTLAGIAGAYIINPFDVLPEGILGPVLGGADDIGALALGIGGAIGAKRAKKSPAEVSKPVTQALAVRHERGRRSRLQHKSDADSK